MPGVESELFISLAASLGTRIISASLIMMMQVNFLTKLVALRPGKTVREMIKNVMQGKDEGADDLNGKNATGSKTLTGIAGRVRFV